jgi:hypothetical protein
MDTTTRIEPRYPIISTIVSASLALIITPSCKMRNRKRKVRFMGLPFLYTVVRIQGKEPDAMDYSIVWVRGHVEVYDWAGRFCFSADNEREAREELAGTAA